MNGAEDMIVDHNMVVTQVFRRLGKRLDRPRIAAKLDLRINHTSFHHPLPLSRCEVTRSDTDWVSLMEKSQILTDGNVAEHGDAGGCWFLEPHQWLVALDNG